MNRWADFEEPRLSPALPAGRRSADTVSMRAPAAPVRTTRGDSLLGIELEGYVITRAISSGGMGVVYEARHNERGTRAAVKVLRPEFNDDEELIARFLRESRAISAIKHQNIVEILNFGVLPCGHQYLMMEFLEGEPLSKLIERSAPLASSQVLKICEQLLSALVALHAVGVVHRDLKPANIMLCRLPNDELTVKICDFGLARQFDTRVDLFVPHAPEAQRLDCASNLAGTPEYISPEQVSGSAVNGQADLYCLGVILFEMLTGRLPFQSPTGFELMQLHRTMRAPRISSVISGISVELDAFVALLLSKSPARRPSGAKAARAVRMLREAELS